MFNIFNNNNDEPLDLQKEEIEKILIKFELAIKLDAGVDQIKNAYGRFGLDITNPIPVNGGIGELKYLSKLGCSCSDFTQLSHRLGSIWCEELNKSIDVYETVCMNANHWNLLYFDMFYDRRSSKLPEGYTSARYSEPVKIGPIINAVNSYVNNFPILLPNHVRPDFNAKVIVDSMRGNTNSVLIEGCQAATMIELRGSRDNEIVRKALNGLARMFSDNQSIYIRPKNHRLAIENLMKQLCSQMIATKDEDTLHYYE